MMMNNFKLLNKKNQARNLGRFDLLPSNPNDFKLFNSKEPTAMQSFSFKLLPLSVFALAMLGANSALAQEPPLGAGQILQQNQPQLSAPKKSDIQLQLPSDTGQTTQPGGQTVALTQVILSGNTLFSDEVLLAQLETALESPQDLAGLRNLAEQITNFYRASGYPFARALIPAQAMKQGELKIQVVEGRYGQVEAKSASGDEKLAATAQRFLANLKPTEVIASVPLERSLLILNDLPGMQATPVVRPGSTQGTGDLDVGVTATKRFSGDLGLDNHGSRFSGAYRATGNLKANRLFTVGDQLNFSWLYSSEQTWLGGIQYSLPVGASGLTANLGHSYTDYSLGKGFKGYEGTAAVSSVGLSYPLVRTQQANLSVQLAYQYKDLDDKGIAGYNKATASHALPVQLNFDKRDAFAGGGLTYGQLVLTSGQLDINQSAAVSSDQSFTKLNLQVIRMQNLATRWTLITKINAQWADQTTLDGSESFSLGGPQGVRAYPSSEGSDSRGLVAQLETRYATHFRLTPYAFVDAGQSSRGDTNNGKRRVSGAGLGSSYQWSALQLDASLAWSLSGGDSQADSKGNDPRFWLSGRFNF